MVKGKSEEKEITQTSEGADSISESLDVPSSEPLPEKKEPEIELSSKKCPTCNKIFEGDTKKHASSLLAKHFEETDHHLQLPEKKTSFRLVCSQCGHEVVSDTLEETELKLETHLISHEEELEHERLETMKKTGGSMIYLIIGLSVMVIGASMFFAFFYNKAKKKGLDGGKK